MVSISRALGPEGVRRGLMFFTAPQLGRTCGFHWEYLRIRCTRYRRRCAGCAMRGPPCLRAPVAVAKVPGCQSPNIPAQLLQVIQRGAGRDQPSRRSSWNTSRFEFEMVPVAGMNCHMPAAWRWGAGLVERAL